MAPSTIGWSPRPHRALPIATRFCWRIPDRARRFGGSGGARSTGFDNSGQRGRQAEGNYCET
jgi:hypothetical protein